MASIENEPLPPPEEGNFFLVYLSLQKTGVFLSENQLNFTTFHYNYEF